MMNKVYQALGKLDSRMLIGLMLFLIGLLVFEGWMLVLRKPYTEYRQVISTRASLSSSLNQSANQSSEMNTVANELKQLSDTLSGELHLSATDDKMAATLMESLDHSARQHSITLFSVKPLATKPVSVFEEVSFEVSAKGQYLQLARWMLDFSNTLGSNVAVTEFDMKAAEGGKQVMLTLNIALYRPLKHAEVVQ